MDKKQLDKIDWKRIGNVFKWFNDYKNPKLLRQFEDNLVGYAKDQAFLQALGVKSLSGRDIKQIVNYLARIESKRGFLKSAAAFAITTAAGLNKADSAKAQSLPQSSYNGKLPVKGIEYDVGTRYTPSFMTNAEINYELIYNHLNAIKNQLHCNAVRIYGENIKRLVKCSEFALNYGLQVWLSPRLINGSMAETLSYIKQCAAEAEKLRKVNPNIVFVVANELTLDMKGLVPGETYQERGANLVGNITINRIKSIFSSNTLNKKLNEFLKIVVNEIKKIFKGNITYASGNWEEIEWNDLNFNIIGINHYLNALNKFTYTNTLRELKNFKKPVAVLEFGCATYKDAEKKGGAGYNIVDWNAPKGPEIIGNVVKDENVPAKYIMDLLNIFVNEGVYGAFVHTFVETQYQREDTDPKHDLDTASFNVIKVYPQGHEKTYLDGHIIPKKSFFVVSDFYSKH